MKRQLRRLAAAGLAFFFFTSFCAAQGIDRLYRFSTPELVQELQTTRSGRDFGLASFILGSRKDRPLELPAPTREALRGFFAEQLFYDFKPELFWPYYPERWTEGMRLAILHTLGTGYQYNMGSAIALIPAYCTPQDLEDLCPLDSMRVIARQRLFMAPGFKIWINAVWAKADAVLMRKLIEILFNEPLREGETRFFDEGFIPVREYAAENPMQFDKWLETEPRYVRQFLVMSVMRGDGPGADPADPAVRKILIEGLADDRIWDNQYIFQQILAKSPGHLPKVLEAFGKTSDTQQKCLLSELLIDSREPEYFEPALEYAFGLMRSDAPVTPGYDPMAAIPRTRDWAITMMMRLGEPSVEFLLPRLEQTNDPMQLSLSLYVIQALGKEDRVHWDERKARLMINGLADNNVHYDEGYAAKTLKSYLGNERLLALLKSLQKSTSDAQASHALLALIDYFDGRTGDYINDKKSDPILVSDHKDPRNDRVIYYWEDERLPDPRVAPLTDAAIDLPYPRGMDPIRRYPWLQH